MQVDWELFEMIGREIAGRRWMPRVPEPDSVMEDDDSVAAFVRAGRADGPLAAVYLYHLGHMCSLILPGDRVLELATGPAALLSRLARLNRDSRFVGIDLSEQMLAHARASTRDLPNVELRVDDMTRLSSIADASVDAVVSSMSLHQLPDLAALEETFVAIRRVLRPSGAIYLGDFARLKSRHSVEYIVRRAAENEERAFARDTDASLCAAFSSAELTLLTKRYFGERARVYANPVSPFVVVKSAARGRFEGLDRFGEQIRGLPAARRTDLRQMTLFLQLAGLRNPLGRAWI